jgi:hypothetical protein
MRAALTAIVAVISLFCFSEARATMILLGGEEYEFADNATTVSHGFTNNLFSTPVAFTGEQRFVRITAVSLGGQVAPGISAGTFFTDIGYLALSELLFFKTGSAPKRASELFVYDLIADAPLTPNGNPVSQVTPGRSVLHDFIIDTSLLAGAGTGYTLQLSVGEDYYDTMQIDNSGVNVYALDGLVRAPALVAAPEPASMTLLGIAVAGVAAGQSVRSRKGRSRRHEQVA